MRTDDLLQNSCWRSNKAETTKGALLSHNVSESGSMSCEEYRIGALTGITRSISKNLPRHLTRYGSVDQYREPAIRIPTFHTRKRGLNVLLSTSTWDVSFSGYCEDIDVLPTGEIDIALTAVRELRGEIGELAADPSKNIVYSPRTKFNYRGNRHAGYLANTGNCRRDQGTIDRQVS
jgi:hypothetical protein